MRRAACLLLALAPAVARAQTYACGDSTGGARCEGAIPDANLHAGTSGQIESSLLVAGGSCGASSVLGHVDARVSAIHDWNGDLRVTLIHPDGTAAVLLAPRDSILDDVDRTFAVPDGAFAGKARTGQWTLRVEDTARHGIGALLGWSVTLPCPDVKIVATDASAGPSPADVGTFTVTRTGPTDVALDVALAVSGTAGPGDVSPLPQVVTIPTGATSAVVTVTPIDDGLLGEGEETVIVAIAPGGYTVNAMSSAQVTLVADGGSPPPDAGLPDAPLLPDAALPDAAPPPPPDAAPPPPPDAAPPAPDAAAPPDGAIIGEAGEGCGCHVSGTASPLSLTLFAAALLFLRRRRRR